MGRAAQVLNTELWGAEPNPWKHPYQFPGGLNQAHCDTLGAFCNTLPHEVLRNSGFNSSAKSDKPQIRWGIEIFPGKKRN